MRYRVTSSLFRALHMDNSYSIVHYYDFFVVTFFFQTSHRKYKREEWCDLVYQSCSDSYVAANCIAENECDGMELGCDGPDGECGPADSLQYR